MIPSAFVVLEVLPLTPNGKIDRDALPPPDLVRTRLAEVDWVPRTSVEAELVKIWTGVLGLERVGIHDNFFELGGHSLKATQLVSRVRNRFQVEVPLSSLFETPTIAGLAKYIEAVSWDLDLQASDFGAIASENREEVEF
jgi:acyl carrier protein